MTGTTDKVKGAVKQGVGKATGDKKLEREGHFDKAKGHAKDVAHDIKKGADKVLEHASEGISDASDEIDEED